MCADRMAVLVGSFSGALAQFIASPTDLVKVKMQADRQRSNEGPRKGYQINLKKNS